MGVPSGDEVGSDVDVPDLLNVHVTNTLQVRVEHLLKARPEQQGDAVEQGVQHGDPPSLHHQSQQVSHLDHDEQPNRVEAGKQVVLDVFQHQRNGAAEDAVEGLSGTGLEEVRDEEELVRGRVHEVLQDGPQQHFVRELQVLRCRHVHQNGFVLNLKTDIARHQQRHA